MSGLPIRHVPAELVAKLSKVAGLLGSAHDGELSAAAYRATVLIRDAGLTWAELIHAAGPREPKEFDLESDWRSVANECPELDGMVQDLTDWERAFLANIAARSHPPSKMQREILDRIATSVGACV